MFPAGGVTFTGIVTVAHSAKVIEHNGSQWKRVVARQADDAIFGNNDATLCAIGYRYSRVEYQHSHSASSCR